MMVFPYLFFPQMEDFIQQWLKQLPPHSEKEAILKEFSFFENVEVQKIPYISEELFSSAVHDEKTPFLFRKILEGIISIGK
jgi:hypothetical protein